MTRLGAFGWISPPNTDIVPNNGLRDIRAALDWVQKYIHLFGGDPDSVTAMGESAGAGAIMHLITAYGGTKEPPPFQQVCVMLQVLFNTENKTYLFASII
jgi:carboxylesterase type B